LLRRPDILRATHATYNPHAALLARIAITGIRYGVGNVQFAANTRANPSGVLPNGLAPGQGEFRRGWPTARFNEPGTLGTQLVARMSRRLPSIRHAPQRQPQRKLGHDVAVRQQPLYLRVSSRCSPLRLRIAAHIARYAKRIVHVGAEHRTGCICDDTRRPQHIKMVELTVAPN